MEEKKPFGTRLEAFFAGKGFYIVLFLCVAIIGVSAWSLLTGDTESTPERGVSMYVAGLDDVVIADGGAVSVPSEALMPAPEPEAEASAVAQEPERAEAPASTPTALSIPEEAPAPLPVQDYYIWPVSGEIAGVYSMAALVWNPTMQDWRTHDGFDIAADLGTQVKAAANGRVTDVYEDDLCGMTVVLTHQNGLQSIYSNLAAAPTVGIGDTVGVGQVIGAVGDTALGEAGQVCHLHFAMTLDGESVDPGDYLP